jgi:hypothetical protein
MSRLDLLLDHRSQVDVLADNIAVFLALAVLPKCPGTNTTIESLRHSCSPVSENHGLEAHSYPFFVPAL